MNEPKATLEFRKGGIVVHHDWVYDEVTEVGQYVEVDISDGKWVHKRDQTVSFASDVTLNDVFTFISKNVEVCDVILTNCFVADLIKHWKTIDQTTIVKTHPYDPDAIEYLAVTWGSDLFTYEGETEISGLSRPDFDGVGFELQEDQYEDEEKTYCVHFKGTRINWGLDFTALSAILDLPVKLDTNFKIVEEWTREKGSGKLATLLDCTRKFTFEEVLEGIMWELSFYGSHEDKMEQKEKILNIKADIDAGTATLIECNFE